jgi:calmodulin-regulated spectrin-associated protein
MAPQSVSFIDSSAEDDEVNPTSRRISQLNITSGSKTYRVHSGAEKETSPSPTRTTRPTLSSAFKQNRRGSGEGGMQSGPSSLRSNSGVGLTEEEAEMLAAMKTEKLKEDADASKGFVISFDSDTPKKPKPQLKQRRLSSKKNSLVGHSEMSSDGSNSSRKENVPPELMICIDMNTGDDSTGSADMRTYNRISKVRNGGGGADGWRSYDHEPLSSDQDSPAIPKFQVDPDVPLEAMVAIADGHSDQSESDGGRDLTGLIIGHGMVNATDPNVLDEMQRKKEKIMMQSLRRKQEGEENRLRKLEDDRTKKDAEAKRDDERARKKEDERARREAILEQHKLKKEMDRAEEEVLLKIGIKKLLASSIIFPRFLCRV